jgi:hypothetical protein
MLTLQVSVVLAINEIGLVHGGWPNAQNPGLLLIRKHLLLPNDFANASMDAATWSLML